MANNPSLKDHTDALAQYLPDGRTFEAKNIGDSNLRQLLEGLAGEVRKAQGYICTLEREYYPDTTTLFIEEWEKAVGIPDSCFTGTESIEARRRDVAAKLGKMFVQTEQDFIDLAAHFGVAVTIFQGSTIGEFPYTFPFLLLDNAASARYTIVIEFTEIPPGAFPYTFPFIFGEDIIGLLECLFNKVKPANCNIIFKSV